MNVWAAYGTIWGHTLMLWGGGEKIEGKNVKAFLREKTLKGHSSGKKSLAMEIFFSKRPFLREKNSFLIFFSAPPQIINGQSLRLYVYNAAPLQRIEFFKSGYKQVLL